MDNPAQALWDCLHRGSPLIRPATVIGARKHSITHPDDDEVIPPDESITPQQYVYFSNRRQYWYVQIRDCRFAEKRLHSKVGFSTQAKAVTYRDAKMKEWGDPVPPNRR